MSAKSASRVKANPARPKSRDDTPAEARAKAEGWVRTWFADRGMEIGAIGMVLVKAPIVRFTVQTREDSPRSFTGTLDVLRGRVEQVEPESPAA
ncbi:MAG: hypothetical protein JST54_13325 [Deltaproteobacteria bacterium]|nr:hypothetical protein [Deltaproteobacteria bacterium]